MLFDTKVAYRQREQPLEWAYKCMVSDRWRLILKFKINLLNIAYAGSKAINFLSLGDMF